MTVFPFIVQENPLNTDNTILAPVCLPWESADTGARQVGLSPGDSATVAGWGKVTHDRRATIVNVRKFRAAAQILQKLDVALISDRECQEAFPSFNSSRHLCAGGKRGQ